MLGIYADEQMLKDLGIDYKINNVMVNLEDGLVKKTSKKNNIPSTNVLSPVMIDDESIVKWYLNYRNPTTKRFIDKLNKTELNKLALGLTKIHQAMPEKYREGFYMNEIDSSKSATIDEFTIKGQYVLHCKFNKGTMKYDCTLYQIQKA